MVMRGLLICLLPLAGGSYVAATTFYGSSFWPWRAQMVDLEVYRRAGGALIAGVDPYDLPGSLPFLYPPFAALLSVPFALLPPIVVQLGWTAAGVLAILAVMHRYGLSGWVLSLTGTAVVVFVEPVTQTLAYGQLGIILVALVVLDLVPGPRVLPSVRVLPGRPHLPTGVMTGIASAVKLTPAIFWLYLLFARRFRAAGVSIGVTAGATVLAAAVAPQVSLDFWGRLARGDTGLGTSIIFYTNQSVMADLIRLFGTSSRVSVMALGAAALVALLGVWAATRWHRVGDVGLAVTLCGIAGLLASPVSWAHHFVWIVPFALCMAGVVPGSPKTPLPRWFRTLGWVFVGWVAASPFSRLPYGGDVELQWTWTETLKGCGTALLGIAVLLASVVVAGTRASVTGRASGSGQQELVRVGGVDHAITNRGVERDAALGQRVEEGAGDR